MSLIERFKSLEEREKTAWVFGAVGITLAIVFALIWLNAKPIIKIEEKKVEVVKEIPKEIIREVIKEVPKEVVVEVEKKVIPDDYYKFKSFASSYLNAPVVDRNIALAGIKEIAVMSTNDEFRNELEIRFRKLGIPVSRNATAFVAYEFFLNSPSNPSKFSSRCYLMEGAFLVRNGSFIRTCATIWEKTINDDDPEKAVNKSLDQFAAEYLAQNPKK